MRELRRAVRDRVASPAQPDLHPDLEWALSGAMALAGASDGPPELAPAPLASYMRGAWQAFRALAGDTPALALDAPALLAERAAVGGLVRAGAVSPGGSCRLLRASDGWVAVNLARADDRALLPAWLDIEAAGHDVWARVIARVRRWPAADVVARARLLGLPAAVAGDSPEPGARGCRALELGPRRVGPAGRAPRVVDLSSLWAGPLCAHLLGLAGARVAKVESTRRPDGARAGPAAFFDLLNAGKASAAFDLEREEEWKRLRRLLELADIVIESARPRALTQQGIQAERWVAARPGRTWVAITGYGRREPGCDWVAFGDDAAVAGGLVAADPATPGGEGEPHFCGDAIADPLTGLRAALGALESWRSGGGHLLDVSLRDLVAELCDRGEACGEAEVRPGGGETGWEVVLGEVRAPVRAPRSRAPSGRAATLGADTESIFEEWAC